MLCYAAMNKRIHFPLTTAQQRRRLFETWEATGDVEEACRTAHVSRRTFYTWKPRFLKGGYAALDQFPSRAPKRTQRFQQRFQLARTRGRPEQIQKIAP